MKIFIEIFFSNLKKAEQSNILCKVKVGCEKVLILTEDDK